MQELFTGVYDNGYFIEKTTFGAISPSTGRTLPDRYIEGTCPICGYPSARGDQCDNCGNQLDPADLINPRSRINGEVPEFVETQHFFLDLPALADALKEWLDEREATGTVAAERDPVQPEHPRGHPPAGDDPRHRLGHPGAAGRLAGQPDQAALRVVRRGHRLPLREHRVGPPHRTTPRRGASGGTTPEPLSYYFMGKDNITFHSQIWPAELLAYSGKGDKGGKPGEYGELNLPTEVVSSEFLTMEGKKFSSSQRVVIYVRDLLSRYQPDAFRYFVAAAGPGEPGLRLHLGRVRTPHQRRARRRLGQPGQPHGDDDRQELRRDPGRRRADRRRTRRCSTTSRRRSASSAT